MAGKVGFQLRLPLAPCLSETRPGCYICRLLSTTFCFTYRCKRGRLSTTRSDLERVGRHKQLCCRAGITVVCAASYAEPAASPECPDSQNTGPRSFCPGLAGAPCSPRLGASGAPVASCFSLFSGSLLLATSSVSYTISSRLSHWGLLFATCKGPGPSDLASPWNSPTPSACSCV